MDLAWTDAGVRGILWGGWGKFWGKTEIGPACSVEHVETEKFAPDSTLAGKVLGQMANGSNFPQMPRIPHSETSSVSFMITTSLLS